MTGKVLAEVALRAIVSHHVADVGGAELQAARHGGVNELRERSDVRHDPRAEHGGYRGQLRRAVGHEVRAGRALPADADRGAKLGGRLRIARSEATLRGERGDGGQRDVLAAAGEHAVDVLERAEIGECARAAREIGERDGIARLAWRLGRVDVDAWLRAPTRARDEVQLEPREPGHRDEVVARRDVLGRGAVLRGRELHVEAVLVAAVRVVTARLVLRVVDHALATEEALGHEAARKLGLVDDPGRQRLHLGLPRARLALGMEKSMSDDEVEVEVVRGVAVVAAARGGEGPSHAVDDAHELRAEAGALDLSEDGLARLEDRVEDRVDPDVHGQLLLEDVVERDGIRLVPEPIEDDEAVLAEHRPLPVTEMQMRVDAIVEARRARLVPGVALRARPACAGALPLGPREVRRRNEARIRARRRLVRDVTEIPITRPALARKCPRTSSCRPVPRDGHPANLLLAELRAHAGDLSAAVRARARTRTRTRTRTRPRARARSRAHPTVRASPHPNHPNHPHHHRAHTPHPSPSPHSQRV